MPTGRTRRTPRWSDRARAYLDINCGHCHSPTGPANTSGLWLDAAVSDRLKLGFCKQPVAAGKGTGNRLFDIAPGQPTHRSWCSAWTATILR